LNKGDTMIVDRTADLLRELYGEKMRDISIDRIVIGIFFTGVKLSDGSGGVAYTPRDGLHDATCCASMAARSPGLVRLKGMTVRDILAQPATPTLSGLVKLVVMNALSSRFLTHERYHVIYDMDALDLIDLGTAGRIGMVGAFIPFLKQFKLISEIDLSVIEMRPEALKADEMRFYVPADKAGEVLPACDTVIITGASMATGNIDELLAYTRPGAKVIVTGPTASILPDVLFENNVTAVSGVRVTEPDLAIDLLAEGAGAYHLFNACVRKMNIVRG
jgi:uncharacterized protein